MTDMTGIRSLDELHVEPLLVTEERVVNGGETFSVEWVAPEHVKDLRVRWVLVADIARAALADSGEAGS